MNNTKYFICILMCLIFMNCATNNTINKNYLSNSIFNILQPEDQEFIIDSTIDNEITGIRGTYFFITANTFIYENGKSVSGDIKIIIREVLTSIEIAFTGITMEYYRGENTYFFESAGMFYITAEQNSDNLLLADGKEIEVIFTNPNAYGYFILYKLNQNMEWELAPVFDESTRILKNSKQFIYSVRYKNNNFSTIQLIDWNPDTPKDTTIPESESADFAVEISPESVQMKFYIDELTWWNLDYPHAYVSCLKGEIINAAEDPGNYYWVFSLGVEPIYSFPGLVEGNEFKVNALSGSISRIIILDNKGNISISDKIAVTLNTGFFLNPEGPDNYMQDIGTLELFKVPVNITSDRDRFMKYLGL